MLVMNPAPSPAQENLTTSDNFSWIALASRQDLDEAIEIAKQYPKYKAQVVKSKNGWHAVLLGPYEVDDISGFRQSYSGTTPLPSDAMLTTKGASYLETEWTPSSAPKKKII